MKTEKVSIGSHEFACWWKSMAIVAIGQSGRALSCCCAVCCRTGDVYTTSCAVCFTCVFSGGCSMHAVQYGAPVQHVL